MVSSAADPRKEFQIMVFCVAEIVVYRNDIVVVFSASPSWYLPVVE